MAASGHWPITKAPVTATAISVSMPRRPLSSDFNPLR